jgi:hypothetical protein
MAIEATIKAEEQSQPSTVITVSGILGDLNNGLDRAAIATKYQLSAAEVTEVFKHPKLKGLRARRKVTRISIVDDTEPTTTTALAVIPTESVVETDPAQLNLLDMIADTDNSGEITN